MGHLLLLTFTLLSHWFLAEAQPSFTLNDLKLAIEPNNNVRRGTNLNIRCRALVSTLGQHSLSREYTVLKDTIVIYTKNTSSSEDLLYPIPEARASNSGKYKCQVVIEGQRKISDQVKLIVTGVSTPELQLNKDDLSEGEEVTARCTAPGETGSIIFYFYDNSKDIHEEGVSSNHVETKLRISNPGIHKLHCSYTIVMTPDSVKSTESNNVSIIVKELSITPILEISPEQNIFEGDQLNISCTVHNTQSSSENISLFLVLGTRILAYGNHSMVARADDTGEFRCKLVIGGVEKVVRKMVTVTELFSVPTLDIEPAEVFQGDNMKLTCKSENYASERLRKEELTYSIDQDTREDGVFSRSTPKYEVNYTCTAQAKGIVKHSKILPVQPKVSASRPTISVDKAVILGRPFKINCLSEKGSPPINYTLKWDHKDLNTTTVKQPQQQATFMTTIYHRDDLSKFVCVAKNNRGKDGERSGVKINATVIEPLSQPLLTVLPDVQDITEGHPVILICGIKGTTPVTFSWYRNDSNEALDTVIVDKITMHHEIPVVGTKHSGTYYCEANNDAKSLVRSQTVTIVVRMATWKKGVIGASILLLVAVLVLLFVLRFRTKRGKREAAAELSVKPSSPKSDDSLTVSLSHDTEVYNAPTVRVDRAITSVWTEKPSGTDSGEESSVASNEPDVEYTEVVHPNHADPTRVPPKKGTDTVYSELQNSPYGAADHNDYGSVEYAELNVEQPGVHPALPEDTNHNDLPVPVE